jgi:hypothetical protein
MGIEADPAEVIRDAAELDVILVDEVADSLPMGGDLFLPGRID